MIELDRLKNFVNKNFFGIKKFWTKAINPPFIFRDAYNLMDSSYVVKYSSKDINQSTGNYAQEKYDRFAIHYHNKISLISSVRNEESNIEGWFNGILNQTHLPDEIIIVDGESTDGTKEKLEYLANKSTIPIRILFGPKGNIARNRNIAIKEARFPIIAVTDFGCFPKKDWLEKIAIPFEMDKEILVSAGIYDPIGQKKDCVYKQKKLWSWSNIDKVNPQNYLPPGGSMAFRKAVWDSVGGYPEWLTLTGEDTYFDLELKHFGGKWAFAPEAIVEWVAPEKILPYLQKLHKWAIGDGEAGIRGSFYWKYAQRLIFFSIVLILAFAFPFIMFSSLPAPGTFLPAYFLGVLVLGFVCAWVWAGRKDLPMRLIPHRVFGEFSQLLGFIRGAQRRPIVAARRYEKVNGLVFVLSGVPIDDTGGGARCTQLALEFLRRNYAVVYLNRFPKYESRELNLKIVYPNLFTQSITKFDFDAFARAHPVLLHNKTIVAIVEHPIRDFLPVVERVRQLGGVSVYDLIDAWDTTLGGQWYSPEVEKDFIAQSQVLVATTPVLAERLAKLSNRKVHLLPNAVNASLFDPQRTYQPPADTPRGSRTGIYIGALWGDWFDWVLLKRIAETYPDAAFTIIGDYQGQCKQPPQNLHFLGLKKQRDLPAYLAHADMAIIPWKVNEITQATSPLKVYEYLSMRLPVVAPRLNPLDQIPGISMAQDQEDFIELVGKVSRNSLDQKKIAAFINLNSWNVRVNTLIEHIKPAQNTAIEN